MHSFWVEMKCTVSKSEFIFDDTGSKASSYLEVNLSIDMKCVDVISKESSWNINSEMLCAGGIQCIYGAMAQWTVEVYLLIYPKC